MGKCSRKADRRSSLVFQPVHDGFVRTELVAGRRQTYLFKWIYQKTLQINKFLLFMSVRK